MTQQSITLTLAWRYIFYRRRRSLSNTFSRISAMGIALGVAILITVLSVMNGFDREIHHHLFLSQSHVTVSPYQGEWSLDPLLVKQLQALPHVKAVSPYLDGQGLLTGHGDQAEGVLVRGIDLSSESETNLDIADVEDSQQQTFSSQPFHVFISDNMSVVMHADVGSKLTLVVPKLNASILGFQPRYRSVAVSGIVSSPNENVMSDKTVYMRLDDARALYRAKPQGIGGLRLRIDGWLNTGQVVHDVQKTVGERYQVSDWMSRYSTFFHAIKLEKTMMFIILFFIVVIALFNLLSSLILMLNTRRTDIAMLVTMGMKQRQIQGLFMWYGLLVGLMACLCGLLLGLLMTYHVNGIVQVLEHVIGRQLIPASVYYVDYLPIDIHGRDLLSVCTLTLLACLLTNWLPARMAAKIKPAEVIRETQGT